MGWVSLGADGAERDDRGDAVLPAAGSMPLKAAFLNSFDRP